MFIWLWKQSRRKWKIDEAGKSKEEALCHRDWEAAVGTASSLPAPPMPLLSILLSGSFGCWLHLKSLGELLKSIAALASCQTHRNSLGLGPRLWLGTPGPV